MLAGIITFSGKITYLDMRVWTRDGLSVGDGQRKVFINDCQIGVVKRVFIQNISPVVPHIGIFSIPPVDIFSG